MLPVSKDCEEFTSQSGHLKTLLEHYKNLGHLDTKCKKCMKSLCHEQFAENYNSYTVLFLTVYFHIVTDSCQPMSAGNCILSTLSGKAEDIHQKRVGHVQMFDRQISDYTEKSSVESVVGASECTETLIGLDEDGEHLIPESECTKGVGLTNSVLTLREDHRSTDVIKESDSNTEQSEFLSSSLSAQSMSEDSAVFKRIVGKGRSACKPKTTLEIKMVNLQKLKRISATSQNTYAANLQHQVEVDSVTSENK